MSTEPRVFVLEPTEYSMAKAKRFGQLVFLFGDESVRPHALDEGFPEQVVHRLLALEYDPETDYIAASGDMVAVIAMVALAAQGWPKLQLLCFDHRPDSRTFKAVLITKENVSVVS